jgi:DNA-binding transcriptional MerR regulator
LLGTGNRLDVCRLLYDVGVLLAVLACESLARGACYGQCVARLTRSQVALRLGKSIATVRWLEQEGALSPKLGRGRVRLFDSAEVDELAERVSQTGRTLSRSRVGSYCPARTASGRRDAREQSLGAQHDAMRAALADALGTFLELVRPRNAHAIELAEDVLAILAESGS